jgi:hypothetical protein
MKTLTRQYSNLIVIRDPAEMSLVGERRFNIFNDFIECVAIPSNDTDMINHLKCMDKEKVRSTTTPRMTYYAKNTNAPLDNATAQISATLTAVSREARVDLHAIIKALLAMMFSTDTETMQHCLTADKKEIARKILTGRAGFDEATANGVAGAEATAAARDRSTTSLMVLLTAIAIVAHKAMCVGKRRLLNDREKAFAKKHLTSSLELFDPHNDPDDTDETKTANWAGARVNVLAGSVAAREDFGMTPGITLVSKQVTGEFLVYVWYCLLHEVDAWDAKQRRRIDSTGPTADRNFCFQMCLRNEFEHLVRTSPGLATWFVFDPAPDDISGSIVIKSMPATHDEHARQYLRLRNIDPQECSIKSLNELQSRGSGIAIFDNNSTDSFVLPHDPWSELFVAASATLRTDGVTASPAPLRNDSDRSEASGSDNDEGARAQSGKRPASAAFQAEED